MQRILHPAPETRRKLLRWASNGLAVWSWIWHFSFRAFWGLALAAFAAGGLWCAGKAAYQLASAGDWNAGLQALLASAICLALAYAISLGQSYPDPPSRSDVSGPESR